MAFRIIRNDITKVCADVIVNTANPRPVVGRGTDSAIYAAAGESALLAERKKIGDIARGECAVTPAFRLNADYIIHTVGPSWEGGSSGEREILRSCYRNSLNKAAELKAESIAFPLIATGVYGFPKDEALAIALGEIQQFLLTHEMEVILVVFDESSFQLSSKITRDIEEYIDEHAAGLLRDREYRARRGRLSRREEMRAAQSFMVPDAAFPGGPEEDEEEDEDEDGSLEHVLLSPGIHYDAIDFSFEPDIPRLTPGKTFQERLFELIDASGMDDVTFYKTANMSRKVFSKMKCNVHYTPNKLTAVRCVLALHLDADTARDLMARAGIALSESILFDVIISYFLDHELYNTFWQDTILCKYNLEPLWSEE